jgi:hypothetical protein
VEEGINGKEKKGIYINSKSQPTGIESQDHKYSTMGLSNPFDSVN